MRWAILRPKSEELSHGFSGIFTQPILSVNSSIPSVSVESASARGMPAAQILAHGLETRAMLKVGKMLPTFSKRSMVHI